MNKSILILFIFCSFSSIKGYAQQKKGTVHLETSAKIDEIIVKKKEYNVNLKTLKGYKIQIFSGSEKAAYKLKDDFKVVFPEIPTKISFSSPDWKVQAGNYKTRLEADKSLLDIKKEFPASIVIATDIEIEK